MKYRKYLALFFAFVTVCLHSGLAFAVGSGGFRVETVDSKALGMGSATIAQADNPSAVFLNPAGLTQLKGDQYVSYGATYINTHVTHSQGGVESEMRDGHVAIPHFYYVNDFGVDQLAFGVGVSSTWGTGTQWNDDSFSRYVATKSELFFHDYALSTAYQVNENLSLGIGLDVTSTKANRKKKLLQLGGPDADLQLKGKDEGYGYRLSAHYKMNEHHQFGVQYRSEIDLKYRGKMMLNNLNGFGSNYQAIFGGTKYTTKISSELTLPQAVVIGYNYKPNDKWSFEIDLEWMDWSSVKQEWSIFEEEHNPTRLAVLNTGNPVPKDWESVISLGVGSEYKLSDQFRLRFGYFFLESPIPIENLDSQLPDSDSHGLTVGFGYDLRDSTTLDVAYAAMFFENHHVDNNVGAAFGGNIDGDYEEFINVVSSTITHKF